MVKIIDLKSTMNWFKSKNYPDKMSNSNLKKLKMGFKNKQTSDKDCNSNI